MLLLGDCLLKKEERTAPLLFQKLELIAVVSLESLINSAAVSAANSVVQTEGMFTLGCFNTDFSFVHRVVGDTSVKGVKRSSSH